MKNIILFTCLLFGFYCQAQKSELKIQIALTVSYLERADEYSIACLNLLKQAVNAKDKITAKDLADQALQYANKAKEQSDKAENIADKIEIEAKKMGCFTAAAEADDAEDYCRQLGYYTFEISIYTKKAIADIELVYIQEYLNKSITYADNAYETIKNARAELADAVIDLENCK